MTVKEYYTAPPDEIFIDIKVNALKIWASYKDSPGGYALDKISRIVDLENHQDNAWYMVAMFDYVNQAKLLSMVNPATADMIRDARSY